MKKKTKTKKPQMGKRLDLQVAKVRTLQAHQLMDASGGRAACVGTKPLGH